MKKTRRIGALALGIIIVSTMTVIAFAQETVSPYTIFGTDDRSPVSSTTISPYNAVCNLTLKWSDGSTTYATGFLISGTRVATAAHCMYNYSKKIYVSSIKVVPGDSKTSSPYGSKTITGQSNFVFPEEYKTKGTYTFDYGYIQLPSSFSGTSTLSLATSNNITGTTVSLLGYDYKTAQQWKGTKAVVEDQGTRILHKIDTLAGMSGSPILNSSNKVVAIHNYGIDGTNASSTVADEYGDSNKATKITATVYNFLIG